MLRTEVKIPISNAKPDKQGDIVKKLEELNKWQQEQKNLLDAKQTLQRQLLGIEHQAMYKIFGLQGENELCVEEPIPNKDLKDNSMVAKVAEDMESEDTAENVKASQLCSENDPSSCRTLTSGYNSEFGSDKQQLIPKRHFLKRGEGLKKRFKINPDELKLNNLPKYKYANAHPRLRLKPLNKKQLKHHISNQVNPTTTNMSYVDNHTELDIQEQRFQNLLIEAKNTCSSTPDAKPSFTSTKNNNNIAEKTSLAIKLSEFYSYDATKKQPIGAPMVAWSKILDPLQIQPLQVPRENTQSLPSTEEGIFELLEQKAMEGSFDMDSTCLKEFMTRRSTEKFNETDDDIPVHEEFKNKRLEPVILADSSEEHSFYCPNQSEVEESQLTECDDTTHKTIETTDSSYPQQAQLRVRFSDSNDTCLYEDAHETNLNDTSCLSGDTTLKEVQDNNGKNELFAQFKEALFAALQSKADEHLSNESTLNSDCDVTLAAKPSVAVTNINEDNNYEYSPDCKELQEKTDMIKIRLAELEKEIQIFKDNNILLLKAKQDHELQKSLNAQEHLEAMESLKDEKIKIEIYLHDERVKLEDEKRQYEQNMKMKTQGTIAKKSNECERLKEQIIHLEMQLKSKEANHSTAQSRLRAQIRNFEREERKLHEQIENLTRENKRLENENLKISREQNNKILLQINRNIAKLAPKQIQSSTNPMPEEGPPTLAKSRTVPNCTGAAASSNNNSTRAHKATNTKLSNLNPITNKKLSTPGYSAGEENPSTSFEEENLQEKNNMMDHEEDGDDILREFQMTPEKGNNTPLINHKKSKIKSSDRGNDHGSSPPSSSCQSDGVYNQKQMKREIVNEDGSKDIWYSNGNLKKISADGMIIRMLYYNKDIKETNINEGTVKYYYAETNTWHTTYLDGLEILEFPNGQVEHRYKSGIVEIHYPNNSIKVMDPKDEHKQEEWRFQDGTHLVQMRNGDKILSLPNGQKEIHTKLHKRREYPDGTVKIVYPDGSTETRYSNGRVRLKDKEGALVMDTDMAK